MPAATSQTWAHLNSLLNSTVPIRVKHAVETYFKQNRVLSLLTKEKRVDVKKDGGLGIIVPLLINQNGTIKFRSLDNDPPLQIQEWRTNAYFPYGTLTGALTFKESELWPNMGEGKLADIIDPQVDQALMTIKKHLNWAMVRGASGQAAASDNPVADSSALILGLRDGITGHGTALYPSTYGGLNPASGGDTDVSEWKAAERRNATNGGVPRLIPNMDNVLNGTVHGENKVKLILTSQAGAELYAQQVYPNVQRISYEGAGETVFSGYNFNGLPVDWDDQCLPFLTAEKPASGWNGTADPPNTARMYFFAPGSARFWWHPSHNLGNAIHKDWRVPESGFRRSKMISLLGQFLIEDRRSNGLLWDIDVS